MQVASHPGDEAEDARRLHGRWRRVRRPTRSAADAPWCLASPRCFSPRCAVLWVAVLVATPVAFAHGYVVGPALVYEAAASSVTSGPSVRFTWLVSSCRCVPDASGSMPRARSGRWLRAPRRIARSKSGPCATPGARWRIAAIPTALTAAVGVERALVSERRGARVRRSPARRGRRLGPRPVRGGRAPPRSGTRVKCAIIPDHDGHRNRPRPSGRVPPPSRGCSSWCAWRPGRCLAPDISGSAGGRRG